MDQQQKLSLADFNRELRKYCTSAAACEAKEKECISRLETIITQRDECLDYLAEEKEKDAHLCEEIKDLRHQHEDAVEFLRSAEKRCQKLAAKHALNKEIANENVATSGKVEGDDDDDVLHSAEQRFRRMLRKYCNLYVQFNKRLNNVRVFSLEDNRYFEIDLNESEDTELKTQIWANIGSSSVHLSSWENIL